MSKKKKRIVLGSGSLYRMDFSGTLPELSEICKEEKCKGFHNQPYC